jgi:1-acyl-sn-glycerol-3-phosphate acyltransferase
MDQCLAILNTKRPVHYMAKIEYWQNPKTKWFFNMMGCIPVNRQIHDDNAKAQALEVLNKGLALGLFPEGTRNKTKELLQPFKFGAVSMAKKTNATIVPFAITGTYKFRTKNLKITFGKPFKVGDMELEEANKKLYDEILNIIKKNR